jgi:uncharacterized protein YbjQ (UPF0145 family)
MVLVPDETFSLADSALLDVLADIKTLDRLGCDLLRYVWSEPTMSRRAAVKEATSLINPSTYPTLTYWGGEVVDALVPGVAEIYGRNSDGFADMVDMASHHALGAMLQAVSPGNDAVVELSEAWVTARTTHRKLLESGTLACSAAFNLLPAWSSSLDDLVTTSVDIANRTVAEDLVSL